MAPVIDYFYAPISGYAYLGEQQLVALAERHGCTVNYKPVDIARVFAAAQTTPPFAQSEQRLNYRLRDMQRIANRLGLPINPKPAHWPVPVALAARTIYAAQTLDLDVPALSFAILSAVYAHEQNISEPAVLRSIIESLNMDVGTLEAARDHDDTAAMLEQATLDAIELGVFGSPTYVVNGEEVFFGQDRLVDLESFILLNTV